MPSDFSEPTTSRTLSEGCAVTMCEGLPASRSRTVPSPEVSSRKPFSRIHSSLKIFDRYFCALSGRSTRMFCFLPEASAYLMAPATAAPPEPPT